MTDQEINQVIKQAIDPSASHHARVALIPMLVAAIRAPQWQPIETAPKDGTWVLIWIDWIGNPRSSAFENGTWQNLPWVSSVKDYNPSHWMPLPKPPTE